ncbi:hypothetical protein [Novacetimonas pomaceti]|uniref:Lipoprotein n=1 Tax=Novacetimonas pomaceti TaxID=2021998 RepID=A0ABX5P625_9PROT|nr:hypothetical protein [Novacetimonas pomaceti]MBV1834728.1 hypothetical protein [Novacetimonas pomaceti]PYD47368.1 hypothetical protein C3920_10280 [Novacetimonas pomaceti]
MTFPIRLATLAIATGLLSACATGGDGPYNMGLTGPDGPPIADNDWNQTQMGMGAYYGPDNDGFAAQGLDGGPPNYIDDEYMPLP